MAHKKDILLGAARIRAGKLVAFPTETVYGLGADATSSRAVARVFKAKGRPSHNPLIVHVASASQAKSVTSAWPIEASRLAKAFWPGPLTLVLPKARCISSLATAGASSVGVRCPDHPVALALLRACKVPLVGPSANTSGHVSPTRAEHVREEFEASAVLVLDGGPCKVGIESTVVSLLDVVAGTGGPKVLRPGVVSQKQIDRVARWKPRSASGVKENIKTKSDHESKQARLAERRPASLVSAQLTAPLLSPGLLSKHYAPRIPLSVYPTLEALRAALRKADKSSPCLVIAHLPASDLEGALRKGDGFVAMPTSPSAYATALYEALHESLWFHRMLLLLPPTSATSRSKDAGVWDAVHDRLVRASAE